MRDVEDEDVMRSFLAGDISAEDRERVEERFLNDSDYFEALCGLEDEMMISQLRGDAPGRWRTAFDARIRASPDRQRRVDQTRNLMEALRSSRWRPPPTNQVKAIRWPARTGLGLAAAAGIALVVAGGWLIRRPAGPGDELQVSRTTPIDAVPIATVFLAPGLTRSELGPSNAFQVAPEIRRIRIEFNEPAVTATPVRAVLRPVGGDPIAVTTEPVIRLDGGRIEVSWVVPAGLLPRGDYLVTLASETPARELETVASRFFSIIE